MVDPEFPTPKILQPPFKDIVESTFSLSSGGIGCLLHEIQTLDLPDANKWETGEITSLRSNLFANPYAQDWVYDHEQSNEQYAPQHIVPFSSQHKLLIRGAPNYFEEMKRKMKDLSFKHTTDSLKNGDADTYR